MGLAVLFIRRDLLLSDLRRDSWGLLLSGVNHFMAGMSHGTDSPNLLPPCPLPPDPLPAANSSMDQRHRRILLRTTRLIMPFISICHITTLLRDFSLRPVIGRITYLLVKLALSRVDRWWTNERSKISNFKLDFGTSIFKKNCKQ